MATPHAAPTPVVLGSGPSTARDWSLKEVVLAAASETVKGGSSRIPVSGAAVAGLASRGSGAHRPAVAASSTQAFLGRATARIHLYSERVSLGYRRVWTVG